jgi:hypothetical protein
MSVSPEFLIEGILPANEVHLLGGSSGSGKTTLTFQTLADWQESKPVFGHVSLPIPYCYVSLDRSRSSVMRTLGRLSLQDKITRLVCQEDLAEETLTAVSVIRDSLKLFPDSKFVVIEGFQLLAGEKGNGYTSVARALKSAARACTRLGITILGICHSPKMRIDEGFQHPREMLLGSVSWGAYSDTVIILNLDELTGIIQVTVMPRNAPMEQHHLKFGANGVLQPFIPGSKKNQIRQRIENLPTGRPITRAEILSWGEALGISARTCDSAIDDSMKNKVLDALGLGVYERSTESPLDTAPEIDIDPDLSSSE